MTDNSDDVLNINNNVTNLEDDDAFYKVRRITKRYEDFARLEAIANAKDDILMMMERNRKGIYLTRARLKKLYDILDQCHLLKVLYLERYIKYLGVCFYKWKVKRHSMKDLILYIADMEKLEETKTEELVVTVNAAIAEYIHLSENECQEILRYKLLEIFNERKDDYHLEHLDAIIDSIKNALTIKRDPPIKDDKIRGHARHYVFERVRNEFPLLADIDIYELLHHMYIPINSKRLKLREGVVTIFDPIELPSGILQVYCDELNQPLIKYTPFSDSVFMQNYCKMVEQVLYSHRVLRQEKVSDNCLCSELMRTLSDLDQYNILAKMTERKALREKEIAAT